MWSGVVCLLVLFCDLSRSDDGNSRIVQTAQGPVRGYRDPGGDLFVFHDIPYATAPTGKDRFKGPLSGPIWINIFDAVDRKIICPQPQFLNLTVGQNMQENCLVASVYVPDTEEKNLPVLIQVHGGAYQIGWGKMLSPKHLVKSKMLIVVNFNYRLGVHGFLCLGTPDVPGNAGMKDQVAALRWVNKTIANFGGNPNDVTLQGFSAGSSSVDLLLLSKTTKGLFHKAIPESGANVATWSVQMDPLYKAKSYVKEHGYDVDTEDIYALEDVYKNAPYEQLMQHTSLDTTSSNDFGFSPCIERKTGVEKFLDDYPVNILLKRNYSPVPMLYGFSNMEGLIHVQFGYEDIVKRMNKKFSDYIPNDLKFNSEEEKENIAKEIRQFYFGDRTIGEETILEYINYFSDVMFIYPHLRSLKLQAEAGNNKIYLYEYSFPSEHKIPGSSKKVVGAEHCAQSMAIMDGSGFFSDDESKLSEDLKKMKAVIREIWLNFITTGKPTASALPVEWTPVGGDGSPYMEISLTPALREEPLVSARRRFWDTLYDSYYRAPVPPPEPPAKHTEL